jgi:hypothetical protein
MQVERATIDMRPSTRSRTQSHQELIPIPQACKRSLDAESYSLVGCDAIEPGKN